MSNLMTNPFVLSPTMKAMVRTMDGKMGDTLYPRSRTRTVKALAGKGLVSYHRTHDNLLSVRLTRAGSDMCYYGHLDQ